MAHPEFEMPHGKEQYGPFEFPSGQGERLFDHCGPAPAVDHCKGSAMHRQRPASDDCAPRLCATTVALKLCGD